MRDTDAELFRALLCTAPKVLKLKHQRRLYAEMSAFLRGEIPENGTGPGIASRRNGVQILECCVRILDREEMVKKSG